MSSSATTPESFYLIASSGGASCDVYHLKSQRRISIGRASQNRIVVPDPRCSRNHAEIVWVRGDWYIGDSGSQNGTTVNGQSIAGYRRLQAGDCIRIASYELRFLYDLHDDLSSDDSLSDEFSVLDALESPTRSVQDESTRLDLHKSAPPQQLIADDGASADGSIA